MPALLDATKRNSYQGMIDWKVEAIPRQDVCCILIVVDEYCSQIIMPVDTLRFKKKEKHFDLNGILLRPTCCIRTEQKQICNAQSVTTHHTPISHCVIFLSIALNINTNIFICQRLKLWLCRRFCIVLFVHCIQMIVLVFAASAIFNQRINYLLQRFAYFDIWAFSSS